MSDLKLFRTRSNSVSEILSKPVDLERSLQMLIESNLNVMLGVRFLASEYATGKSHSGRIDTLGVDENACPVIVEYKRALNENVMNQGLFYLDWLLDHKAEVKLLVLDKYGREEADRIDWGGTRLLCVARDFTRYDEHAVQQINRNIELIRYRKFGDDLLLLELVNAVTVKAFDPKPPSASSDRRADKTPDEALMDLSGPLRDAFESLRAFLLALGDDVQEKRLRLYIAFKRLKNFACIVIQKDKLLLYLKLNPDEASVTLDFARDVRNIGHWATGDLELTVRNQADVEKAKQLLVQTYEGT